MASSIGPSEICKEVALAIKRSKFSFAILSVKKEIINPIHLCGRKIIEDNQLEKYLQPDEETKELSLTVPTKRKKLQEEKFVDDWEVTCEVVNAILKPMGGWLISLFEYKDDTGAWKSKSICISYVDDENIKVTKNKMLVGSSTNNLLHGLEGYKGLQHNCMKDFDYDEMCEKLRKAK